MPRLGGVPDNWSALIAADARILRAGLRCINIQARQLHVEPTAGLPGADIAKVPLITARRPAVDMRGFTVCEIYLVSTVARWIVLRDAACRPGDTRTAERCTGMRHS
jgi:hypothetical protein